MSCDIAADPPAMVAPVDPTFTFTSELWLHPSGPWIFITVPEDESEEIREVAPRSGGFGSVRVQVQIGETEWRTSVFPASKSTCFILPIKKAVRIAEDIDIGDEPELELTVLMG